MKRRISKFIRNPNHTFDVDSFGRLRYVLKNRRTDEVYFVVVFTLLFGEELKAALGKASSENVEREENQSSGHAEPPSQTSNEGLESSSGQTASHNRSSEDKTYLSVDERDQYLKPPTREASENLYSSLEKWIPRMLRSGGTVSGRTTPDPDRRPSSIDQQVEDMPDPKIEDALRERHGST